MPNTSHPWLRPTEDFALNPRLPPEGGSSPDMQFLTEQQTNALWLAKCSFLSVDDSRYQEVKSTIGCRYRQEVVEVLAARLYQQLGIQVPHVVLTYQPPSAQVKQLIQTSAKA
jgi:hypothetical protein